MTPFEAEKLPIAGIAWETHVEALGKANRAISKYDGLLYSIPNPEVLLSPLLRQEAVLSSKIEGTQASFEDVLKFEAGEDVQDIEKRHDIAEIMNYRSALLLAEEAIREKPFNLNLLLRMHDVLLNSVRGRDKARGRFRTTQNWIGPPGCQTEEALFIPPSPLLVPDLLTNWENHYHAQERDPLVQLAVIHAQFEIIHPFLDGNGRLGRILVPLFLNEKQVLSRPTFYISKYLESNRDEYVTRLRNLGTPTSWNAWISFFLRAVESQATSNLGAAKAILDLYESLKDKVRDATHSQYATPLLDYLFEHPIFSAAGLTKDTRIPTQATVATLLRQLKEKNIIKVIREGKGRRTGIYALPELFNICEGESIF